MVTAKSEDGRADEEAGGLVMNWTETVGEEGNPEGQMEQRSYHAAWEKAESCRRWIIRPACASMARFWAQRSNCTG